MLRVSPVTLFVVFLVSFSLTGCSRGATGSTRKDCSDFTNTSCDECLENTDCLWCFVGQRCINYPVETIIPPSSICPLREARWAICWVNFESLIIAMSIVGGLILLPLVCCCCYCCCKFKVCCRKKKSHCSDEEEVSLARQQEERMQRCEQRKSDRRKHYDEILKKYGLIEDSDPPFCRFENE